MTCQAINTRTIVLASQAPWRSAILNQLGIKHLQQNHRYQEPPYRSGALDQFIESIAVEKARSIVDLYPHALIIAADQLVCIDQTILYKSGDRDTAIKQLSLLNGRDHQLICGLAVWNDGDFKSASETATLKMRQLENEEISFYVDADQPWDCAGSYKIESLGASLFESIQASDPTTIVGLPAHRLLDICREWGYTNLKSEIAS